MATKNPIATYQDIIELVPNLFDSEKIGIHSYAISPLDIREAIIDNDSEIRGILVPLYGDNLKSTPYLSNPTRYKRNSGGGVLLPTNGSVSIEIASTIPTSQVYKITFTSETEFEVESEYSGDQGAGNTGALFTTSDGYLTIPLALWKGSFETGDIFYLKAYMNEKILVLLSSLLTAANIMDSIYAEQSPDTSTLSQRYQDRYNRLIGRILDKEIVLLEGQGVESVNLDPIQVDYEINDLGLDETNYADDEWPRSELDY